MSAKADNRLKHPNEHWFVMDRAVPAEAIALVVGDLHFKATGARTGVSALAAITVMAPVERPGARVCRAVRAC